MVELSSEVGLCAFFEIFPALKSVSSLYYKTQMKQIWLCAWILTLHFHMEAQSLHCVQTVRYDYLKPKLDPSICIPHGNHIISIDDKVDLNDDGLADKVVRWQNARLADGDTVHYSIYIATKDGRFLLHNTLSNVKPLYFSDYEGKSENKFFDSIKRKYIHPSLSVVGFEPHCITVTFYVEPTVMKELFFTYSSRKDAWILTREIQWAAPSIYKSTHKLEYDREPSMSTKIEDFDMLRDITHAKN
ncbi:MAG TPA: hypothetical protein VL728_11095 [Cyclobacteriaceae bacterium]|jgi:hypothetical protein|nr:hypothetical protein [Cyclobacteriaceae bacterium]